MSTYDVQVSRRAAQAIGRLPRKEQRRVQAAIELLAGEPRPPGCVAMSGEASVYRVRVGSYRIVYEVVDRRLVVLVVRVGHRRDVYRPH
ncbi:MAG: type II toxin-antitoxin system RelE/ParE family toxin [Candidatus Microthrix subdominans]